MARFEFYISDEERATVINHILSKGTKIIPDLLYETEEYEVLRDTIGFFKYLKDKNIGFF